MVEPVAVSQLANGSWKALEAPNMFCIFIALVLAPPIFQLLNPEVKVSVPEASSTPPLPVKSEIFQNIS